MGCKAPNPPPTLRPANKLPYGGRGADRKNLRPTPPPNPPPPACPPVSTTASITIRNLDDDLKSRLCARAAGNGRSMEEEARLILRDAVGRKPGSDNLADIIRTRFGPSKGVDMDLLPRGPGRESSSFD